MPNLFTAVSALALAVVVIILFAALERARETIGKQRTRLQALSGVRPLLERLAEPTTAEMVAEFHTTFGHPVRTTASLDVPETLLRLSLLREELAELEEAVAAGDVIAAAAEAADVQYVLDGAALTWGFPLEALTAEIHRSNMTKLGADGKPIYGDGVNAPAGKVLKGPNYQLPKPAAVLATTPAYRPTRAEAAAAVLAALDIATGENA